MERWVGRVAVVTGASAGIGAAIAYQLQDAGLTVVALARRAELIVAAVEKARKEAKERGRSQIGKASSPGKLHSVKCDVSKEEDILSAFKWIKEKVGRVDILVNNAGVIGDNKLSEAPTDEWRRILDINVVGLSVCSREAIKLMRAKAIDDGHIVHIGSISGHNAPQEYPSPMYFASKHAVRVLTEGLRKELVAAKSKIRVSEVCPGNVRTDVWTGMSNMTGETWYKLHPYLESEDVADAVLFTIAAPPHVQIHDIIIKPVGELL